MAELVARHVFVSGSVQGVGFRYATQRKAVELGVRGWVRNLHDGRVEVWSEGERAAVDALVEWLARGPASARVTHRQVAETTPTGARGFELRHDG